MGNTAIYMRVSTKLQADKNGVEAQEHVLRAWAVQRGVEWDSCLKYTDKAFSGGTVNRPEFLAMCEGIRTGEISQVVSRDVFRLSRSTKDFIEFMELCVKHECGLSLCEGDFDLTNVFGQFTLKLMALIGELDRKLNSARSKEGIRAFRAKGEAWGGARTVDGRPGTSKVSLEDKLVMFQDRENGMSISDLAEKYGIRPRTVGKALTKIRKQQEVADGVARKYV